MDLVGLDPSLPAGGHLHLNWTGWGMLADLLHELGCSLEDMSGSNDGDVIPEETCLAWADALRDGRSRLFIVKYPDPHYVSGFRSELHVSGTDTPVLLSSAEQAEMFASDILGELDQGSPNAGAKDSDADRPPIVQPAGEDPSQLEWLEEIELFFRSCGGAAQY